MNQATTRLKSLQLFVAVVEAGSFSKAAERMGSTQPSVSRHIAQLEDTLGALLLQRTTRSLTLTEAGEIFFERARLILQDVEAATEAVRRLSGSPSGVLRVTVPASFGRRKVAPLLAAFHQRHPDVTVGLSLSDSLVDVIGEGHDLAIRFGALEDSSFVAQRLALSRSLICAHPSYLAVHPPPRTPEELQDHNCLLFRRSPGPAVWRFSRGEESTSVQVAGSLYSDAADALLEAALHGLGVVHLPEWMIDEEIEAGNLVQLLRGWDLLPKETPIHALYPHKRHLASKVRVFVEFLLESYRKT